MKLHRKFQLDMMPIKDFIEVCRIGLKNIRRQGCHWRARAISIKFTSGQKKKHA